MKSSATRLMLAPSRPLIGSRAGATRRSGREGLQLGTRAARTASATALMALALGPATAAGAPAQTGVERVSVHGLQGGPAVFRDAVVRGRRHLATLPVPGRWGGPTVS